MRQTLDLLRGLQELDQDLYRVKDELRRLPKERDRRRERIDERKQALAELESRINELRARIKEIEDMTTSQRQRQRKLENEINGTADQALIAAYQHEIRSLKRDVSEAEEEGLRLVETAETYQTEVNTRNDELAALEQEFADYSTNIDAELADAETRRSGLADERKKRMTGPVEGAVIEQYEKLLDAREGQAMAMLEGKVCQGCYVSVPSNIYVRLARGVDLVLCPSCGRILYLPENA